jgi:nitroreductase
MLKELVIKNRSYRRFQQAESISLETLKELVDTARFCASGSNSQPLRYILSCESGKNALIFQTLAWARLIQGWGGPQEGERPAAYIVILHDKNSASAVVVDHGIAAQTILLAATEKRLGGCMLGAIKKDDLRKALNIPENLEIVLVIALGKPGEKVVLENVGAEGNTKYWRDQQSVHHVPKRALKDIIVDFK